MTSLVFALACFLSVSLAAAVCDGNPHSWGRQRRCDAYNPDCPAADWGLNCTVCEGIGGIPSSDDPDGFVAATCVPLAAPKTLPSPPAWPKVFTNGRFWEVQVFVKHDPFCLAQIPAMVSNGTHCFKRQQGTFTFNETAARLRIDYVQAETTVHGVNETEHFFHEGTRVHPQITRLGGLTLPAGGICPCIDVGAGIVVAAWAHDAAYVGRERLFVEFLEKNFTVDHWVKGPHHVWADVATKQVVRLWQPWNGLEVFDPTAYDVTTAIPESVLELPESCKLFQKLKCIDGTGPSAAVSSEVERAVLGAATGTTLA